MSFKNKLGKSQGFTIVELLIVVVVIAILAAITIVSYNGITARANTSSSEATASTIIKKAEAYNAEPSTTGYPATLSLLTGTPGTSYYVTPSAVTLDGTPLASPSNLPTKPSEINFYKCGHSGTTTAPTSAATITTTTGVRVINWNYSTNTTETTDTGQVSGNAGPTSTWPVNCQISAS